MKDAAQGVRFSQRTAWQREEPTSSAPVLYDLTTANPARCGLALDADAILGPLTRAEVLDYAPEPFGRLGARAAVCADYARHGAHLTPDRVCLTASTSEAYSYLLRLLCDAGDEVLLGEPGYPLFSTLAALDDVVLTGHALVYDHGWSLDVEGVRRAVTPRTRAIAVVHPNNPTGHFVTAAERLALEQVCAEHRLALLVDEVFLDYAWDERTAPVSFAVGPHPVLTCVLSGLSKLAALPQMKVAWAALWGPESEVAEALARLEVIADTFLSVSAPAQAALPVWLGAAGTVRAAILERVRTNLAALDAEVADSAVTRLAADGGWYAVLRVPALEEDRALAARLLREQGVLVHPGSAFGFAKRGWLVVSLLAGVEVFAGGVSALVRVVARLP